MDRDEYLAARARLDAAAAAYYADGTSEYDDAEYDAAHRKVAAVEAANPGWVAGRRLDETVGAGGGEVRHRRRMLSLENVFDAEELGAWVARVRAQAGRDVELTVEPKLDGLAVSIVYVDGSMERIVTRGDGSTGERISTERLDLAGAPRTIPRAGEVEVRGELTMTTADFAEANQRREAAGLPAFVNPRNAAAGAARSGTGPRMPVTFHAYELVDADDHVEAMVGLRGIGFTTARCVWQGSGDVAADVAALGEARAGLPVGIDGAVVKARYAADRRTLGDGSRTPKHAVAYKYPAELRMTTLERIDLAVGRTGVITPVGRLRPVHVGGATVSSVNLHNFDDIARKDLREGDIVWVRRAGDVIPEIVGPVVERRRKGARRWRPPTSCPSCGGGVDRSAARTRCAGSCGGVRRIIHAAGRTALDIDGLGTEIVEAAVDAGIIATVADLYRIDAAEIADLEVNGRRLGEARAESIAAGSLEARRRETFRHLVALGIPALGVELSRRLQDRIVRVGDLARLTEADLAAVDGIGPDRAALILAGISGILGEIAEVDTLADPPQTPSAASTSGSIDGWKVCITGTFDGVRREEIAAEIAAAGGRAVGTVTSRTDLLVAGEGGGRKRQDAVASGVRIVDLEGLRRLIAGDGDGGTTADA